MMHWIKLAYHNVVYRPLQSLLSVLLFVLAVGLLVFLSQTNQQIQEKFDKNLAEIDLVIGAKGSPLQMILCNMYHIDAPTGNISLKEALPFLRKGHPLIKGSVPLSLGDSHKGYRIVGTNEDFLARYQAELEEGEMWSKPMDVILGSVVARRLESKLGDQFQSAHGLSDNDDMIHEDADPFVVTGILKPTGSVVDQLILTPTQSVWLVHEHSGHVEDSAGHNEIKSLLEMDAEGKEITSVLVEFSGRNYQSLNMARNINENTNLMAASPALEINRLFSMMGVGLDALQYLVYLMTIVAFISVFISLYQTLRSRKYEIAILKVQGASGLGVFMTTCLEAVLVALVGGVIGVLVGKWAIQLMGGALEASYKYSFTAWNWRMEDFMIVGGAIAVAILAALLPAIQASQMKIHETLSRR